jgi:hypothetical protein
VDTGDRCGTAVGRTGLFWYEQAEFGDTDMFVSTPEQAVTPASNIVKYYCITWRNIGAVVVGGTVRELVMRRIQLCRNTYVLLQSMMVGKPRVLTLGEVALAVQRTSMRASLNVFWIAT